MHEHSAVKLDGSGAPADVREVEGLIRETWQASMPGHPWRVELKELRTFAGLVHYLSMHHGKVPQRPPKEWRGMHHRPSRGYFHRPVPELRSEAKAQLWAEGLAYSSGLDVADARLLVDGQRAEWDELKAAKQAWRAEARWAPAPALSREAAREAALALFGDEDIPF